MMLSNKLYHILLADDDEADKLLFTDAFSEIKIQTNVYTVNDGIELMDWLHNKDNHLPDILFLDLNMPRKDGLECLIEIRADETLKDIFIVIYSTSDNEKDIEETFHHGANVYLTKPNNFNALKQALEKAVKTAHIYTDKHMNRENFILLI